MSAAGRGLERRSRRRFVKTMIAAGAAGGAAGVQGQTVGRVSGFDHVALPMQNTDAMLSFYRALGFSMRENPNAVSVFVGNQMINFHRPGFWQSGSFTLRAAAARPPCGDLCFVWDGTLEAIRGLLTRVGAAIEVGPVERPGGRQAAGTSVYTRDPDGNLLEFIIYP